MGDRCYMVLIRQRADKARVDEALGEASIEEPIAGAPSAIRLEYEEVNYGAGDQRAALAEQGRTFVGYHEDGDEYGAYEFAAHGGRQEEIELWRGSPVLLLTDALEAAPGTLDSLERLRTCRAAACAALSIDPATFRAPASTPVPQPA